MNTNEILTEEFKDIYEDIIKRDYEALCDESHREESRHAKTFGFIYKGFEFDFEIQIIYGRLSLECVFINGEMADEEIGYPIIQFLT